MTQFIPLEILFSVQASLQGSQIPLTEIRPPLARTVLREAIRITFAPGGITQMNVLHASSICAVQFREGCRST
jgi:hypothetical protein